MQTRTLGMNGPQVSIVGLGCNNFGTLDLERSRAVVHRALDAGITLFDTADVYGNRGGSEEQLGQILGDRRKDIVLATKFGMPMDDAGAKTGGSRRYIAEAVEASLKRLKTDTIDLYQLHRPDPKTPIEETLGALPARHGPARSTPMSKRPAGLSQKTRSPKSTSSPPNRDQPVIAALSWRRRRQCFTRSPRLSRYT